MSLEFARARNTARSVMQRMAEKGLKDSPKHDFMSAVALTNVSVSSTGEMGGSALRSPIE
jgi:hypothetical protein